MIIQLEGPSGQNLKVLHYNLPVNLFLHYHYFTPRLQTQWPAKNLEKFVLLMLRNSVILVGTEAIEC